MRFAILCAAMLSAGAAGAADLPSARQSVDNIAAVRAWKISVAPLLASQILDASSSYGMRELNPLLASADGGFDRKGAAIKMGITGAAMGVEYLVIRKYPRSARVISKLNWSTGIVTTGFAIHNYAIK
jgi:hypothetical protein